jgi:hypothetical protein
VDGRSLDRLAGGEVRISQPVRRAIDLASGRIRRSRFEVVDGQRQGPGLDQRV